MAQDVISLIDGQKIRAKVTEVAVDHVKFKYYDNLNGPTYMFQKKDIVSIRYQDGKVESFQQGNVQAVPLGQNSPQNQNPPQNQYPPQNRYQSQNQPQNQEFTQPSYSTSSDVQTKFTVGIRAGFNLTNMSSKYDGMKQSAKYLPGFQVGIIGAFATTENFAIQPGVLFATQGARFDYSYEEGESMKGATNLSYIQIPINFQYIIGLEGMKLLLQAGPYIGYAVSGKSKSESTWDGKTEKFEQKIEFGSDGDKVRPFDFGIGLGVGLNFNNIQIGLGYNLGLANLTNYDKASTKNNGFALTLTYMFGKRP